MNSENTTVCIVGLGYVGFPLAEAFADKLKVIGFDTSTKRLAELRAEHSKPNLTFTDNAEDIRKADFAIICVPTPVTSSKEPDLSFVESAAQIIGRNMKEGTTVILESTVYPGVTEDIIKPILEKESGTKCGTQFRIGYSPERINPGDVEHTVNTIVKVVAGMDDETTELIAELYSTVTPNIFKARSIRTAEAAKVIENIQRDLNIALMNEFSLIFDRMGLNSKDVLDAAATKWNFHRYTPGMVGGHCIPVDPYYMVYKSRELGFHPQVILAGRATNDNMPVHVAHLTIKALNSAGKLIKGSKVVIMGLTYKENVADTRETPVVNLIKELKEYGINLIGFDPLLKSGEEEFDIEIVNSLNDINGIDALILTVGHDVFKNMKIQELKQHLNPQAVVVDIRQIYNRSEVETEGFTYVTI